jgi:hypothetical protein
MAGIARIDHALIMVSRLSSFAILDRLHRSGVFIGFWSEPCIATGHISRAYRYLHLVAQTKNKPCID